MDPDFGSVAELSITAALFGQGWIDEKFEPGTWENGYYTSVCLLRKRDDNAWRTYLQLVGWDPRSPSSDSRRTLRRIFRDILGENGIDLIPF